MLHDLSPKAFCATDIKYILVHKKKRKHLSSCIVIWCQNSQFNPLTQYCILMHLRYIAMENIVRKKEIACNNQYLLFSQCFLPYIFHLKCTLKCCLHVCNLFQFGLV